MSDPLEARLRSLPLRPPSPALDHRVAGAVGRPVDDDALEARLAALPLRSPGPSLDARVAGTRAPRWRLHLLAAAAVLLAVGGWWFFGRTVADRGEAVRAARKVRPPAVTADPVWIGYPERTEVLHDLGYRPQGRDLMHRVRGVELETYHLYDAATGQQVSVTVPVCREYRRRLEVY